MQEQMVRWFAERLPPLSKPKRSGVAVFVAVVFGGFGLALYLRSWIDAAIAAVAVVLVAVAVGDGMKIGFLAICAALAQYAYTRVEASNRRLSGHMDAGPARAAVWPAS